ncbi:conjugative transposon protein TraN [Zhouia sp. PK063]|uniref:conjugative transposon protein TraN n=1 Tax=Zhouia sp. PK063 TaxID=3373602 RepID=UPI0037B7A21F
MKHLFLLWCCLLGFTCTITATTLKATPYGNIRTIPSYPIAVATTKTTNLIFSFSIRSVDRGSNEVLVQKAQGVENILQIKAASIFMEETNLTVITADGTLYSFLIHYAQNPPTLNYAFGNKEHTQIAFSSDTPNLGILKSYAEMALGKQKQYRGVHQNKYGIRLKLSGLYIHNDVMYYRLHIENHSNIPYHMQKLRFFIKDKKHSKRTTFQQEEVLPLYSHQDNQIVQGNSQKDLVIALPQSTIPNQKVLTIQLLEDHGGRHLQLKIKNRFLLKATVL